PIGRIQLRRSAGGNGLRIDPSAEDPLAGLRHLLRDGRTTASLHLSDEQLADLEAEADAWPSLADVRKAWVARSRRQDLPFREPLAGRIEAVLHELGAYDASGRVRLGRKVEPYDSPSLRAGLVRR